MNDSNSLLVAYLGLEAPKTQDLSGFAAQMCDSCRIKYKGFGDICTDPRYRVGASHGQARTVCEAKRI